MQLFYAHDIATNPVLPGDEAVHAIRVLRLGEGAEIILTDGKGFFYKATIGRADAKHCSVNVTERWQQPPLWNFHLHIGLAPTKNIDRVEWFCEKATEIGIDAITFLHCRFSERRELKNISRLEKILAGAMKQSQKATLPKLTPLVNFEAFVREPFDGQKFIAHCEEGSKGLLKDLYKKGSNALILIGPEGDFSPEEIRLAISHGFIPVSLGASRLRTETAALAACHSIQLLSM